MNASIALVLDRSFGDRLLALAQRMPVWVVSSPVNDRAVHKTRANPSDLQITTLKVDPKESSENLLMRAIYAIDEHHGEASQSIAYNTLHVYGAVKEIPPELMSELNFKSFVLTSDGLRVQK